MNWKEFPVGLSGIYLYENIIDGKRYVGQSCNLRIRIRDHERNFTRDKLENTSAGESVYLWRAVRKYGRENFTFSILEECSPDDLDRLEIEYIKKLKSHQSENGYNFSWGGNQTNRGMKFSDETKDKMSKSKVGILNSFFGKTHSNETRNKISKWREDNKDAWYVSGKDHFNSGKVWDDNRKREKSIRDMGINNPSFGKKHTNANSKYYGVKKDKNYWVASISYRNKKYYIKTCSSEIEAARFYNKFIISNNFPHPLNDLGDNT